jgi:hypothetical protein
MPTYKIKTTPAHTVLYPNTLVAQGVRYNYKASRSVGSDVIQYEEGPKYIRMDGKQMCNWKRCAHTRGEMVKGLTGHFSRFDYVRPDFAQTFDWYDVPVALYSSFDLSSYAGTIPPATVVDDLTEQVYTDIAGRTNEFLLTLEDFAGLFSGKSLWKGVRGVAGAIDGVSKAISQCRKLARAFGWKNSLYSMWLSSKEAVRQAIGLRLGYRFSFKTTLNDIERAVDFGYQFGQFAAEMTKRNQADFLRYSKRATVSGDPQTTVYRGDSLSNYLFSYSPNSSAKRYFYRPESDAHDECQFPDILRLKRGGRSAVAFAKARVRYPVEYLTMRHYFESRFGLDKPLTTLWAIVPLSFVVDYLLNVQDAATYVDNKLNDYLVATNIGSAWVCETTFRESVLDIPECVAHWHSNVTGQLCEITWPHVHTVYRQSEVFNRSPISSSAIRAQLPSMISADDNNWVRSVGTGLELLSQTRLR